ncbi:MAG: hypothetical protein FJ104_07565, partial [Deltaproteobacteria bacterium]|nr:hypothetical protein [Deltaproteobacteria bacterium]
RLAGELLGPLGLEPLQAGGGGEAEADAPTRYEDGGAIGVQMIRGDMSATGLGTVTRVEGDRLVAFGHPMMESGVTALPTAVGRVLWFLASQNRSFKIGMPVRSVGALVNDRQASIVVSHAARAPVIPVTLSLTGVPGAPHTEWKFEVAHEKFMTPSFVSVALGSAVQAAAADRQDVTWVARSRLAIRGHGEITLEDQGLSIGGTPDPREFVESSLVRAIGAVLNNPWESALVERVHVDLEFRYARDVLRLRGATLLDPQVYAGGTARVRLAFESFAGPPTTKVVDVPIPRHLAGQTVTLTLQPGYSVTKERPAAERLSDLIANLADPVYPPKSLVVSYPASPGVSFRGKVADNLPAGALDSIRPETASVAPETHRSEVRHVFALPSFLNGQDRVSLAVKPVLR